MLYIINIYLPVIQKKIPKNYENISGISFKKTWNNCIILQLFDFQSS